MRALSILLATAVSLAAQDGGQLAAQWCASCHTISADRPGSAGGAARDVAPPFKDIAKRRSPEQIRAFLTHPHGNMPPIELSNQQIDNLVAYMQSLLSP